MCLIFFTPYYFLYFFWFSFFACTYIFGDACILAFSSYEWLEINFSKCSTVSQGCLQIKQNLLFLLLSFFHSILVAFEDIFAIVNRMRM
ncbi:hypothetical protein C1646_720980 [Rhizophagus diaphanus]|nr:hypothetical protein C1646_720980 [Rhizophagus diaphanus] [Rhizophagus sp. MUCL 43196]